METNKTTSHKDADAIAAEFKDYAYSVSHDLSAPVRAMVEFSKLLGEEHTALLNDEGKEYLGLIVENGQKLQAMMDGLLAYSRLNTMAKPFCKISAGKILDDMKLIMADQILASGAQIEIDEMPMVHADIEQLLQVFAALIDNAIKFQPKGNKPVIRIAATEKDGFWQFSVADNGIGVNPKFQDKIFKLFGRLHSDDEYPGVGIGLTLAQKTMFRHGGRIWIESKTSGCVFYLTLPINLAS